MDPLYSLHAVSDSQLPLENQRTDGTHHCSQDDAVYSDPDHTPIILLLFKVEPEWVGRVEIQNDCAPIGRTIGILSVHLQIIEICGSSIGMTIDRKADNGMIALCGWAASPWLFFDLLPLDDAFDPTGFNRCPGSETPGSGKPDEKAYPTDE